MREKNRERGFTLVEVIITIVIMAISGTTVATRFNDLSDSAKASACQANQLVLERAQLMYYTDKYFSGKKVKYAKKTKDLKKYLMHNKEPKCPRGGKYKLSDKSPVVTCNFEGHSP